MQWHTLFKCSSSTPLMANAMPRRLFASQCFWTKYQTPAAADTANATRSGEVKSWAKISSLGSQTGYIPNTNHLIFIPSIVWWSSKNKPKTILKLCLLVFPVLIGGCELKVIAAGSQETLQGLQQLVEQGRYRVSQGKNT